MCYDIASYSIRLADNCFSIHNILFFMQHTSKYVAEFLPLISVLQENYFSVAIFTKYALIFLNFL